MPKLSLVSLLFFLAFLSCRSQSGPPSNEGDAEMRIDTVNYRTLEVSRDSTDGTWTFMQFGQAFTGIVKQEHEAPHGPFFFHVKDGKAYKQMMYYRTGELERYMELKDGKEHGKFLAYFKNGNLYVEQFYEDGEAVGTWKRWDEAGILMETIEH